MASKGFRQFSIMQYERNPKTGEDLHFGEENILSAIQHKTIQDWSYIVHDKDTKQPSADGHPDVNVGDPIPRHWDIVIKCKNAVEVHTIANWFGVPANFVEVLRGANAFWDRLEYQTHEHPKQQALGKYHYPDEEIKCNIPDWRAKLTAYQMRRAHKKSSNLNTRDYYREAVLYHGMTINQVVAEDKDAYLMDDITLDRLRLKYLKKFGQVPPVRMNFYFHGRGGVGKGLLCKSVARSLGRIICPDLVDDDEIFHTIGGHNVSFEGYDGQPIIIWEDARAVTLLQALGSRENVFQAFDTHPSRVRQHVKYDSIVLVNTINIICGTETHIEFLDGLAGEYRDKYGVLRHSEDKGQSYRRFPIIIPIHEDDFDILLNKGVLEGTNEYQEYIAHEHIRGNMERISRRLTGYSKQLREVQDRMVAPIIEAYQPIYDGLHGGVTDVDIDELMEEFADYGTVDEEACREDERRMMEQLLSSHTERIVTHLNHPRTEAEYYKALVGKELLENNPEEFLKRTDLHFPASPFDGAYQY